MQFSAIVNVPGYMPMADEPALFDTAADAWAYLAEERERGEDGYEGEEYSETRDALAALGEASNWRGSGQPGDDAVPMWLAENGLAPDGTGTVYGGTPGYDGDRDLGLAYSVATVTDEDL